MPGHAAHLGRFGRIGLWLESPHGPSAATTGVLDRASDVVAAAERAGVASGLFNASREVAGLLGITVIGVVLTARQTAAAHAHASTVVAFLDGYRLGLVVAAGLVAAGGAVAWFALPRPSATSRVGSSPRTDGVVLRPLGGLGEQDAQPFG